MSPSPESILHLEALEVGYRGNALLPPIQLEVGSGQMWAILGPNGAGKTTLLRTLLGLLPPVRGAMRWSQEARLGYVPQRTSLDLRIPARVRDVVRDGALRRWSFLRPFENKNEVVQRAMRDARVEELADQAFSELSEGQKQRALVARALAAEPRVLVLDEPTSAMDLKAEKATLELLDELRRARQIAVLLVSHHLHAVGRVATHALLVDKDHQAVVGGPLETVAVNPACVSLYGAVLHDAVAHNHNCCDHDHILTESSP